MARQTSAKRERIIEAVRLGLEGDEAIAFIRQNGFVLTAAGIARHLRALGGRGRVQELIDRGKTNSEILKLCAAQRPPTPRRTAAPFQWELFDRATGMYYGPKTAESALFPTKKIALTVPSELYEAIRAAAKGEGKTQNRLIVELLTTALSRMTAPVQEQIKEAQ